MTYKIVGVDGKEYGPVTAEQMRQWAAEGRVNSQTRVLAENESEWRMLGTVPELVGVLPIGPGPVAPFPQTPSGGQPGATNSLAVIALVLGLLSLPGMCCCCGLPLSIPGIVCAIVAMNQINKNPGQEGKGLAMAGLVLSIFGILLGIGWQIFLISSGKTDYWLKRMQVR